MSKTATKTAKTPLPKLRKFRVVAGHHYHGELVWKEGMVLASRLELDKLLAGKFERVGDETPVDEGIADFKYETENMREMPKSDTLKRSHVSTNPEAFDDEDGEEHAPPDNKFRFLQGAADVTDSFPFVLEEAQGLKVLRNGNFYGVVAESDPRTLLNADGPLKKGDVVAFVEKYLEE